MAGVLLESRSFRPFKSSEEYLYAMKEDLAEWFQMLYPHLRITVENFLDRLETGVALCEHANAVKVHAAEYVQKKQARKVMTRSVTGSLAQAQALVEIVDVKYFVSAKPGTFFARDNVSNFIHWCRQSLQIIECLLFESDDLIMRKNEKHVILCLLEVARRGARFGMLAPMLVQMERQIDREIAADQRKMGQFNGNEDENGLDEDSDSEIEDEQPVLMYGPLPQIVTNDLKSLDEMVRDLVEKCTCPTQFPMIRVSEGKYRIGDTKVLIFVRILRNHVMVRVGGGWDTLAHYLDKHDPCRCRSQHRTTQGARLVNKPGAADLVGAQVYYDRSPPRGVSLTDSPEKRGFLSPPSNTFNRSRSRSPSQLSYTDSRRSASPNLQRRALAPPANRSRSPTPNFTSTHITKLSTSKTPQKIQGPQSLPYIPVANTSPVHLAKHANAKAPSNIISSMQIPVTCKSEAILQVSDPPTDHSDNTSEVSDEGYRSLGLVVGDRTRNRTSLYSQNSTEDAECIEHQDSLDYEDDTNDVGLRRTQFSQKIYPDETKQTRIPASKLPSRSNSSDAIDLPMKTKIPPSSPRKSASRLNVNNTWNGKTKTPRASLTPETFTPQFSRASPARRSIASFDAGRRNSHSANTSPTKSSFRQELLRAAKKSDDDNIVFEEVQKLLKQFGSLNFLNDLDDLKKTEEGKTFRSRKDARPDVVTRIPAPISHRA